MLRPGGPIAPGAYVATGNAALLRANEQQYLFQQQLIAAGTASIAVQLERLRDRAGYPNGVSLQVWFTNASGVAADPGAFEVDTQTSDNDVQYADGIGITAVNATNFSGRIELPWIYALFLRVNVKTLTNAVYSNALVTR
jgi:hypothetical protein